VTTLQIEGAARHVFVRVFDNTIQEMHEQQVEKEFMRRYVKVRKNAEGEAGGVPHSSQDLDLDLDRGSGGDYDYDDEGEADKDTISSSYRAQKPPQSLQDILRHGRRKHQQRRALQRCLETTSTAALSTTQSNFALVVTTTTICGFS
jgi:hypothetical protein